MSHGGMKFMSTYLRNSGIELIGEVPWGAHFCQFYQSADDLIDILVPYFKAGLENNEFCMWITSEPVNVNDAMNGLRSVMPDIDRYLESGQLEILPYTEWYLEEGCFDCDRVLRGWVARLNGALKKGFEGLRLTGNTFWLEDKHWRSFTDYEHAVDNIIGQYRMVAICTYHSDKCGVSEVADVISNHQFALIKRNGSWEVIESSERKRAEATIRESEARHRMLFGYMPYGFAYHRVLFDDSKQPNDYIFLETNSAFEQMTGLKRDDITGKRVTEVLPGIEKSSFDWIGTYGTVATTGGSARFEQYSELLDRWYAVVAYSPLSEHFVAIFSDITDKKRKEEEIRCLNESLTLRARELEAANRELDERAHELQRSNKDLELFAYAASHDLREPLRKILSFSERLRTHAGPSLDDKGRDYLSRMENAAHRMMQLIDGLLALSRVSRKAPTYGKVNLSKVVEEVLSDMEIHIRESGATIEAGPLPAIEADSLEMRQLFQNLISNAMKFCTDSPRIAITCHPQDYRHEISIQDNGIGFDEKYLDEMFKPFRQLHHRGEYEGVGMGLAMCERIVSRYHGTISAKSSPGKGATFTITLPAG
jgi:PAS domain S-box-containing protein